jgi:hypothetical protein
MRIEKLCGKNGNEKTKNPYFYNNFTMALKMGEPTKVYYLEKGNNGWEIVYSHNTWIS